jgi:rhodanese-related sulfurtransferase
MLMIAVIVCVALVAAGTVVKYARDRDQFERHSITAEDLHRLLASHRDVALFDVRLPLDLFTDSVLIPGAKRVDPEEVIANPALIPKDRDLIVYCTCPSDKTSRAVLRRALAVGYLRVKFLKGGLEGWKARGYPVEPYEKAIRLASGGAASRASA